MTVRYAFVALVACVVTVFALQNHAPTSVRFVVWSVEAVPLATVILVSVAAGLVIAGVPLWVEGWRLRARVRALEARLGAAGVPPAVPNDPAGGQP